MVINKVEFEFDVTDQVAVARMEKALDQMGVREKEIMEQREQLGLSQLLEKLNTMVSEFFITTTGQDILEGVTSYKVAQEHYYTFLAEVAEQKNAVLAPYSASRIR